MDSVVTDYAKTWRNPLDSTKSSAVMDAKRWTKTKGAIGHTYESTDFGEEVGSDEIHWWVFEREPDVDQHCDCAKLQLTRDNRAFIHQLRQFIKDH